MGTTDLEDGLLLNLLKPCPGALLSTHTAHLFFPGVMGSSPLPCRWL